MVLGVAMARAFLGKHTPRGAMTCPACAQLALVEASPAKYLCSSCSASFTRIGTQLLRNEDHVPVARLK